MKREALIRTISLLAISIFAGLYQVPPLHAGTAFFADSPLAHAFLTRNDRTYVALDDIAGELDLSVLFDGDRLLIGGTVHGTLIVDPDEHSLSIDGRTIDYENSLLQEENEWYVPDRFLRVALGIGVRLDAEGSELALYPLVTAITPADSALRITSSLPPDFRTFEIDNPSRRVIDIDNAILAGLSFEIDGSEIGIDGLASLRASQFTIDPPVVRVVLEWEADTPPQHAVFPEHRSLAVLVGSGTSNAASTADQNLLEIEQPLVHEPVTVPETPVEPDDIDPLLEPSLGPEVPSPFETGPDLPSVPIELPEDAENLSLSELGWDVELDMDAEGELVATLTTPPFEDISDFTLSGDGMRLVIDLLGTVLPGSEREIDGLGDVERIRFGQFQPSVTRIVFDIERVRAYQLTSDPDEGSIIVRLLSGDLSGKVIVIDPGHGGEDPGAVLHGLMEKDLNLEMAYMLKEFLEEHGATIVLTRETDVYVTLANRINIAEANNTDLFVCIHNNATEEPTALQGSLLLYNNPDYMELYRQVHRGIAARTGVAGLGPVFDERGLYILRHAGDIPVVFLEGAFMTNSIDFARLTDQSRTYSSNIMTGVMDGLLAYYAGRDLPPVAWPEYGYEIETGVFDLAGRPIVLPGIEMDRDSVTGIWDTPGEVVAEEEPPDSSDEDSEDQDSADGDEDGDDGDYHRVRGRGAYRY